MAEGTAQNGEIDLPWTRTDEGGEPLLLVNGMGSPLVAYEDGFVAELTDRGFDVARFDNRDSGRATATSGGYLLIDMATDAIAVMDDVGWSTAHVFGMSMGGMIVQQLGISFADRLRSITSVMSSTGNPKHGTSSRAAREALVAQAPKEREAWIAHRVASEKIWASPAEWTPESSRAKGELMYDYGIQNRGVMHHYNAVMNSPPREDELAQVQVPTLVLHGSQDMLLSSSGGRRTAEVMANARYVELDGMGHDLPASYWPIIAGHVADHVAALAA